MKLNFIKKEDKHIEVEFVGEDITFPNALRDTLLEDEDVEFAACVVEHPEVAHPKLIVRTGKKKALSALKEATKKLSKKLEEFRAAFKKEKGIA
ncbi:MAG: DNA-directed RNA polymerase subunit L [Candidatus Micrarchaeia archaeon]